ncbi:MAG: sigma-54 dependent transcriptional regulator, acetoin dehydrogenase operon transcriptional [Solirubrobacteraceae bacterium]|nr:sigma-54 dependent transcriptional regulator, acetoin dehydrogenase operon transcriptional [Solirubrobacteraceae bacterium]
MQADAVEVAPALRPEIEESQRRCAELGLDPHRTAPYIGDLARGERIRTAAAPVLDELCSLMQEVSTGVVLTDHEAQVIDLRTRDADLSGYFEDNGGLIGFGWSEEHMGTTAIALAIKLRKPIGVAGDEHYLAALKGCTAAAAPIFDPFAADRLLGGLVLSGREESASPHMLAAVVQAARAIEQRLYEDASPTEHRLLTLFEGAHGQTNGEAVFVINERMLLCNSAATEILRAVERSTLWNQALDTVAGLSGGPAANLLTLRDGRSVDATFAKADPGSARAGILVRVAPAGDEAGTPPVRRTVSVPQRKLTAPAPYLQQRIADDVSPTAGLLIVGEPGSGKLATAEEIHRRSGRQRLAILDGATDPVNGGPDMLRDVAATASSPDTTLVIRHLECLSQRALTTIRSLVSHGHGARLIATMTAAPHASDPHDLGDLFPDHLQVPPLRNRLDEFPAIVAELMRRHGAHGRMQPAAMQTLARHEWPGNIRELESVISLVVASRHTCDITSRDLPASHTTAGCARRLTRMEHVERSAIHEALMEANGNRTKAAAILQIGRATLYRKIKSYGLDVEVDVEAEAEAAA